jgi:hypothetical protein
MKTTVANPVNTTNAMGKKRKRPKNIHKSKKDDENILSKDIEDDSIRYMMDTKKNLKPREDLKSTFTLKNLRFKPQKYKGSFLPYHLRWIFNNNVKSNEIVLLNEIEGLENEINRLKCLKLINRECRKIAGLPFGITTNFCQCCHLFEKKKHDCSHKYCNDNCPRKKAEELMNNLIKNNKLKELKDSASKDKNNKKLFNDNTNEKLDQNQENNNGNIQSNIFHDSSNSNYNLDSSNKIILDKSINNNEGNSNSRIPVPPAPNKKRLIFGTVERSSKERRSIFMVQSDNNSLGPKNADSTPQKVIEIESKNNDSDAEDKNKDSDDNCSISISDSEIEEVININNEEEEEDKKDKSSERKNNDKDIDEDDVIIINQSSPHHNENDNDNEN